MPTRFINPLLLLLVSASRGHLAKQIQYLKAENEVLRARLPEHIRTTPAERAKLLKFGKPLGSAIQDVISIVHPRTFARWVAKEAGQIQPRPLRRRRTPEQIRALVIRIAARRGGATPEFLGSCINSASARSAGARSRTSWPPTISSQRRPDGAWPGRSSSNPTPRPSGPATFSRKTSGRRLG
jgi:hypothetical protein